MKKKKDDEVKYVSPVVLSATLSRMAKQVESLSACINNIERRLNIIDETVGNLPAVNIDGPVGIERACEITGKAKDTIYRYSSQGLIPCYRHGKKLYFFEEELLAWVRDGKKQYLQEECEEQNLRFTVLPNHKTL